jgi:hypothetical protein
VLRGETLMSPHRSSVVIVLLTLSLLYGCGRPPADNGSNSDSQRLPFDRQPPSSGISPSQSLIPSTTKLPEGTPIPIRLQGPLSSASANAGDTFSATVDEAVVIDGQTMLALGTTATGRVLEAKPAASGRASSQGSPFEPGYLRIVLVNVNVGGRPVAIETSSIFVKGGPREDRNSTSGAAAGVSQDAAQGANQKDRNIIFGVDRRLNFRLAQTVDLQ